MSNGFSRARPGSGREEPDEWLLDAARRAGHKLSGAERPSGTSAWRMLLSAGIPDSEVLRIACAASGADAADFSHLSPALSSLLPHGLALKHRVAPLGVHNGTLSVATSNPRNPELERELAFAARQRVRLLAASPTDVIRAQGVVYGTVYGTRGEGGSSMMFGAISLAPPAAPMPPAPSVTQPRPAPVRRLSLETTVPDDAELSVEPSFPELAPATETKDERAAPPAPAPAPAVAPAPAPDLADRLLTAACAEHASDAVLEPTADGGLLVRLCVDGTLNDRFRIPEVHAARLVQTLKQRARLDPQSARAQQGGTTFEAADGRVTVRVSTEPAGHGRERVTLRFFSAYELLAIGGLGFAPDEQHRFGKLLGSRAGLVIVAGPAGAGKTTTMYAAAAELRRQGRIVATVEQLIDYPLEGIAQTQVSGSSHSGVAGAVRAALDDEGDVVVVGAPVDAATLELCGAAPDRLVIASLDTSDMPSTLSRLHELHPDGARLAEALVGVVAQRLVRRLCPACALPQGASEVPEQQQRLLYGLPTAKVRRPVGCPECRTTGYQGRMLIAEVVPVTRELRDAIARGADSAELARVAHESGLATLWDSGLQRVLIGSTSLAELLDTVPAPEEDEGGAPQEDIDALLSQLLGEPHMQAEAEAPAPLGFDAELLPPPSPPTPPPPAPVAPPRMADTPQEPAPPAAPPRAPAPVAEPAGEPGALRVLLVNDDSAARRALAQALTQAGMQVLQAADGVAALAYVRRLRPDIVLTEIAVPRLDAVGLMAALAEDDAPPMVVVHTEQADDAFDAWLLDSGARDVLRQSLPVGELIERLVKLKGA